MYYQYQLNFGIRNIFQFDNNDKYVEFHYLENKKRQLSCTNDFNESFANSNIFPFIKHELTSMFVSPLTIIDFMLLHPL